ncbi:MAG: cadherin domain-containing protein [Verrucomicrobia bacterium]|nr:cadherin domain-containing protein [Verrucomicrobiota bacterium]
MTSSGGANGLGTAFQITPAGVLTTLVEFNGNTAPKGRYPQGSLVQGTDGNFYGLTSEGGANTNNQGTAFQMTPAGVLTTLVVFSDSTAHKGAHPYGSLVQGTDGNFYGLTPGGGASGYGTAFQMTPAGVLTTLVEFNFSTALKGAAPYGSLVQGTDGNFYGLTRYGGANGVGTAFKLVPPLNTAPTNIALNASSVPENQPVGATIGYFTTQDPNSSDTHNFTLVTGTGSDDNASFTITDGTNLVTAAVFDYEAKSSYSIRVRATDSGGLFFEKQFTIAVTDVADTPPSITAQPQGVTNGIGGAADFTVTASGSPPLAYQWLLGSNALAGATNATLALTSVARTNSGHYAVAVTNAFGSVTSSNALLSVGGAAQRILPLTALGDGRYRISFSDFGGGPLFDWDLSNLDVEGATDLNAANWAVLTNAIVITNGVGQVEFVVTNSPPQQFYRVRMR